jgi:DNA polymerase-4
MERLYGITSQVEQVSIDEAFLDVSDLPESGEEVARRLQSTIRQELDLPCSLGVATNKLVAKIANDTGKHRAGGSGPPCAITVVSPGEEATFLAPLPTQALWGVGPKTAARLAEMGIHNIGDIASAPEKALVERFGKNGRDLTRRAHGTDDSPIVTSYDPKSFSQETTFASDLRDGEALRKTLSQFSQGVSEELKHHHRLGGTVRLKLRWPDFTTLTRQAALSEPTDQAGVIFKAVVQLFEKVWKPGMAVRLIGVGVSHLTFIGQLAEKHPSPLVQQLSLFDAGRQQAGRQDSERQNSEHQDTIPQGVVHQKEQLLNATLEELRQRFGEQVIQRGKKPKP